MNLAAVILVSVSIIAIIIVIAWLLYKANSRAKEITVKAGVFEAKMERDIGINPKAGPPTPHTQATQEAIAGGRIEDATIKAPADSGATAKQKAEGEGSSITGSDIELSSGCLRE
jgi:hypothetical protein